MFTQDNGVMISISGNAKAVAEFFNQMKITGSTTCACSCSSGEDSQPAEEQEAKPEDELPLVERYLYALLHAPRDRCHWFEFK